MLTPGKTPKHSVVNTEGTGSFPQEIHACQESYVYPQGMQNLRLKT